MSLEATLESFPKELTLKAGQSCPVRPLESTDETSLTEFFRTVPHQELMFIKHRVTDASVIHGWCQNIDLGRNLPLLAFEDSKVIALCTLHQQLGGWKRHIGRVSVLVRPECRGRGLARALVTEMIGLARHIGLEKVEAEFMGDQAEAMKVFGLLGFSSLVRLQDYVKDMQANSHDYVLMGLELKTDEEFAGVG